MRMRLFQTDCNGLEQELSVQTADTGLQILSMFDEWLVSIYTDFLQDLCFGFPQLVQVLRMSLCEWCTGSGQRCAHERWTSAQPLRVVKIQFAASDYH